MKAAKYQKKSQIKLEDLLRRRKSTLNQFLKDRGITTYEGLDATCKRLGVLTPNYNLFIDCINKYVSNPSAGVVIVNPSPIIIESTGNPVQEGNDTFEDIQPQVTVTSESEGGEVSVVLQEAKINPDKLPFQKHKKFKK